MGWLPLDAGWRDGYFHTIVVATDHGTAFGELRLMRRAPACRIWVLLLASSIQAVTPDAGDLASSNALSLIQGTDELATRVDATDLPGVLVDSPRNAPIKKIRLAAKLSAQLTFTQVHVDLFTLQTHGIATRHSRHACESGLVLSPCRMIC